MRIYGVTGGIGSGKSEAAKRFAHHGIPVIDADKAAHELIEPGGGAEQPVINEFGDEIVANGHVDRAKLAEQVFSDDQARKRLNRIVHPMIAAHIAERCRALAREGAELVVVDAALLGEGGLPVGRDDWLDGLILVSCPRETRERRLVENRGMSRAEVRRRMDAQTPPEQKEAIADWIIDNSGSLRELYANVDSIIDDIKL